MADEVRVKASPVEDIINRRGLEIPTEETLLALAEKGRDLEDDLRGEDVVDRWLERKLAEVKLDRKELEEYALALGEHLTHIQNEGWATWVAGFEERAAGLFLAVGATIQQLDRIRDARVVAENQGMARLPLTAFDFVNALGIRSYDEVIKDHDDWMDELASQSPEIVDRSPLLQFFREDFHALARDAHPNLRNKIVGQATVDVAVEGREAPGATEGMNPDVQVVGDGYGEGDNPGNPHDFQEFVDEARDRIHFLARTSPLRSERDFQIRVKVPGDRQFLTSYELWQDTGGDQLTRIIPAEGVTDTITDREAFLEEISQTTELMEEQ